MKIGWQELVFLAIFSLLAIAIVHLDRLPVYRAQQAEANRAFCEQLALRAAVAWDEAEGGCVLAEKLHPVKED